MLAPEGRDANQKRFSGSGDTVNGGGDPLRPTTRRNSTEKSSDTQPLLLVDHTTFAGVPEVLTGPQFMTGIAATMLGAGVVSIPIIGTFCGETGVIGALLVTGFLAYMGGISLIYSTQLTRATSFEGICAKLVRFGIIDFLLSDCSLLLLTSLGSTAYVLMIAGALDSMVRSIGFSLSTTACLILASFLSAPACFLRSYNQLKTASNFATGVFVCTIFIMLWKTVAYTGPIDYIKPQFTVNGYMLGLSQLATAFLAHFNVPGLYAELQRDLKPRAPMYFAVSLGGITFLYGALAIVCVGKFGFQIGPDMLKFLSDLHDSRDIVLLGTQFLVTVGLCVKAPLVNFPITHVLCVD
eukprot:Selendium_serpulae@DN7109_c0_g1_i1.p1